MLPRRETPTWLGHVRFVGKGAAGLIRLEKRRVRHASGLADPREGLTHLPFLSRGWQSIRLPCPVASRASLAGQEWALLLSGKLAEGLAVRQRWQEIAAKHATNPPSLPRAGSSDAGRLEGRRKGGWASALC